MKATMNTCKQYLGDSVYIDFDGYGLTLTTENGVGASNTIYLEPNVYDGLTVYVASLKNAPQTGEHINAATGERTPNHA